MESLHILRMLLANLSPGAMPNVQLFPARELRFVLEYGAPPDMADQRLRLSLLLISLHRYQTFETRSKSKISKYATPMEPAR